MFNVWPDRIADGEETLYWRGKNDRDVAWGVPIAEILSEKFNLTERMNSIRADEWFKPKHEEAVRTRCIGGCLRVLTFTQCFDRPL